MNKYIKLCKKFVKLTKPKIYEKRLKKTRKLRYDLNENRQQTALRKSIKSNLSKIAPNHLFTSPTRETSATQ